MFLAQYDQLRVINLPHRADRRRQMDRELARLGASADYFSAVRPAGRGRFASIGFHGSYLSHLEVLSEAAAAGESVLILEDDCAFYPRASGFHAPSCDIFYGSHFEDADTIIGAHCMGFSARAAAIAHEYLLDLVEGRVGPDPRAAAEPGFDPQILPPIDGSYVWLRRAHPELATAFAEIARQRSSRSDCTPGALDRIPALGALVDLGRRAKAAIAR